MIRVVVLFLALAGCTVEEGPETDCVKYARLAVAATAAWGSEITHEELLVLAPSSEPEMSHDRYWVWRYAERYHYCVKTFR